ncbi:hypothetical protein Fcan01_21492 [Folsomia candida]|uniref:Uncharacterized protein n=1 Tax=Folsomia candida TaxID=158441 RepID=A0A226DEM6_FOLCA|nr:hypothetical protein Fcan01_21492 [Folsomia candida]
MFALLILSISNSISSQDNDEGQIHKRSHGETCSHRDDCDYAKHLHCFERHCQCYSRVTHIVPATPDHFLAMEWDPERASCFSVLNSICTGTNGSQPPPKKIHAKCLPHLECVPQDDLDEGIGTCQLPFTSEEEEEIVQESPFSDHNTQSAPCSGNAAMRMTRVDRNLPLVIKLLFGTLLFITAN